GLNSPFEHIFSFEQIKSTPRDLPCKTINKETT
ncbi:unnamed protein product, partial [marine sediment metagenome]